MAEIPQTEGVDPPPQAAKAPPGLQTIFMGAVLAALVVAGLYFGQPVLVPVALAILLSLALGPLVTFLQRLHLGHVPSVLMSILFAVAVIVALGAFIGSQFAGLVAELPHYQTNLTAKIRSVEGTARNNTVVQRASSTVQNIAHQIFSSTQAAAPLTGTGLNGHAQQPVPVVISQPNPEPLQILQSIAGPLLEPFATLAIVIVFAGFFLLQKDDLRDRFIRLAGSRDLQRATHLVNEGAERLSRYLMLQTGVNACFGTVIGVGLWLIGVPLPGLWGLIAAVLRFVPYVGVPIAALLPILLSLAVDPGWSMVIWTLLLYAIVEPITGQVIEPPLYGRNMGMSAVAVVVAATFWTWIWGPVGLLLSTPLTMCLVVLGRHTPQLQFLDIMLGDRPPLTRDESFYLRMLADDPDEAANRAEAYLRNHAIAEYYDHVVMKALALAQRDVNRGTLDREQCERIHAMITGLIENLADHETAQPDRASGASLKPEDLALTWRNHPVLCVAGRGPLDEAAAALLVNLLKRAGIGARAISADDASPANINHLDMQGVEAICVSYLEPGNFKSARYLVRRLHKRAPQAVAIAGYWGLPGDATRYLDSIEATECELVVTSLSEAMLAIQNLARKAAQHPPAAGEPALRDSTVAA